MLSFQKLDVYRCAIEFLALVLEIIKDVPRGNAVIVDQLKRAALAVPLNIAEGAGRTSQAEAAHSYAIARGEAMESASALDVLELVKAVSEDRHRRACDLVERLVAMLTKMCR
jgi:four helix bundle protein